jgi:xylose isomerase
MKKLLIAVPVLAAALMFNSCGGGCDASTAEGAAQCMCDMMKEYESVKDDKDKAKELDEKFDKFEEEVEKNIKDGKYSEDDVEKAIRDKKCEGK